MHDDCAREVHHYHHDDPTMTYKVNLSSTTRGPTWEIEIQNAVNPAALSTALAEARKVVKAEIASWGVEADAKDE